MTERVIDTLITRYLFRTDTASLDRLEARVDRVRARMGRLSTGFTIAGAAVTGALVGVGKTVLDFEAGMNNLQAVLRVSSEDMVGLREQAKELGRTTAFSASQVADAQTELAKAGFNMEETMAAVPDVLKLAAAGQLELEQATAITTSTLRSFNLPADEAGRVADVLGNTAASSKTTVEEMGVAMRQVAPLASSMGISLEETSASLGAFQDKGIRAETAGVAMRNMLVRLLEPTKESKEALNNLGVSHDELKDKLNQGDFHGVLEKLGEAGITVSDATKIFGQEAASAAIAIIDNRDKVKELTIANENATREARVLAEAAGSVGASVTDMKAAFQAAGPTAKELGVSVDETAALLAALHDKGLKGKEAGDALREMMTRLREPTEEAGQALDAMGVDYDELAGLVAEGQLSDALKLLADKGLDADKAVAIFGKDTAEAATSVAAAAPDIDKLKGSLQGVQGVAGEMAETQNQGLVGAWKELKSAFEGAQIALGESGVTGGLETLLDMLKDVVTWFTNLDDGVKQIVAGALLAGPGLLVLGAVMKALSFALGGLLPMLRAVRVAMMALAANPIVLAVMAIVAAIAGAAYLIWQNWEEIVDAVEWGINEVIGLINSMIRAIPEFIRTRIGIEQFGEVDLGGNSDRPAGAPPPERNLRSLLTDVAGEDAARMILGQGEQPGPGAGTGAEAAAAAFAEADRVAAAAGEEMARLQRMQALEAEAASLAVTPPGVAGAQTSTTTVSRSTEVNIDKLEVSVPSGDPEQIAGGIRGALGNEIRNAAEDFDSGVSR